MNSSSSSWTSNPTPSPLPSSQPPSHPGRSTTPDYSAVLKDLGDEALSPAYLDEYLIGGSNNTNQRASGGNERSKSRSGTESLMASQPPNGNGQLQQGFYSQQMQQGTNDRMRHEYERYQMMPTDSQEPSSSMQGFPSLEMPSRPPSDVHLHGNGALHQTITAVESPQVVAARHAMMQRQYSSPTILAGRNPSINGSERSKSTQNLIGAMQPQPQDGTSPSNQRLNGIPSSPSNAMGSNGGFISPPGYSQAAQQNQMQQMQQAAQQRQQQMQQYQMQSTQQQQMMQQQQKNQKQPTNGQVLQQQQPQLQPPSQQQQQQLQQQQQQQQQQQLQQQQMRQAQMSQMQQQQQQQQQQQLLQQQQQQQQQQLQQPQQNSASAAAQQASQAINAQITQMSLQERQQQQQQLQQQQAAQAQHSQQMQQMMTQQQFAQMQQGQMSAQQLQQMQQAQMMNGQFGGGGYMMGGGMMGGPSGSNQMPMQHPMQMQQMQNMTEQQQLEMQQRLIRQRQHPHLATTQQRSASMGSLPVNQQAQQQMYQQYPYGLHPGFGQRPHGTSGMTANGFPVPMNWYMACNTEMPPAFLNHYNPKTAHPYFDQPRRHLQYPYPSGSKVLDKQYEPFTFGFLPDSIYYNPLYDRRNQKNNGGFDMNQPSTSKGSPKKRGAAATATAGGGGKKRRTNSDQNEEVRFVQPYPPNMNMAQAQQRMGAPAMFSPPAGQPFDGFIPPPIPGPPHQQQMMMQPAAAAAATQPMQLQRQMSAPSYSGLNQGAQEAMAVRQQQQMAAAGSFPPHPQSSTSSSSSASIPQESFQQPPAVSGSNEMVYGGEMQWRGGQYAVPPNATPTTPTSSQPPIFRSPINQQMNQMQTQQAFNAGASQPTQSPQQQGNPAAAAAEQQAQQQQMYWSQQQQ